MGLKNNINQTEEDRKKTAYHEAGHVIVSYETGHKISRASILPRGNALGVMFQKDKHEIFSNNSRDDLLDEVKVLLGGSPMSNSIRCLLSRIMQRRLIQKLLGDF